MKMSEKLMTQMIKEINAVLEKHGGVVESYRFKMALVAETVDLTFKIRDLTDSERLAKDDK